VEEVFVGIGGETQFRKECETGMLGCRLPGKANGLSGIEPRIGDLYRWDTDRGPDKTVTVEIKEGIDLSGFHGHSFSTKA
jgi:hypothetical protein